MAKEQTKNGLKQLAADAKNRLCKGYWTETRAKRQRALRDALISGGNPDDVKQYFQERCNREIAAMSNPIDRREEDLYRKVKKALDHDGEVSNPVSLMADPELLTQMTDSERQRYIFSLTGKYREYKKRYDREKKLLQGILIDED